MKSSNDRQGRHGDQFLERFHRAKSSFIGSWRCTGGEGYISPISPRGQKKREISKGQGESEKIHEHPLFRTLSLPASLKGHSKRKEKHSSTAPDKTNGQLQPKTQLDQDDFNPRGENLGGSERNTASLHTGIRKFDNGKEKADTGHFESDSLQDKRKEIVEVGDENEASSSMHSAPEKDPRPTDPLRMGSLKDLDFGQNTEGSNEQDQLENLYRPPADFQRVFSSNSEIEEVGEVSNTLNSDSETLRANNLHDRKVEEEKRLHHSEGRVPHKKVLYGIERSDQYKESKESSATGKAGQNIVIPNSGSGYNPQEAENEKVKASEQNESPVSVLSGLGSGRWADFDSAYTPHTRAGAFPAVSSEGEETENKTEPNHPLHDTPGKESDSGDLKPGSSENLEQASIERSIEGTEVLKLTMKDTMEHPEQGRSERGIEGTEPLNETMKDKMEHSSQNLAERGIQEEMDPMVQDREQKLDCSRAQSTRPSDGFEPKVDPSSESEREAQNIDDSLQKVGGEKMQDLLHEKPISDGRLADLHDNSPKTEGLGELPTGNGNSEAPANGVHQDGSRDPYFNDGGVAGRTKLYDITAAERDDRASIYGAVEDRCSHDSDYFGLQDSSLEKKDAQLAHVEERAAWKVGFFSVPHVLVVGALTVLTVLGKAASS